jgi:hypothetical protein
MSKLCIGCVLRTTGNINSSGIIIGASLQSGGETITQLLTAGSADMLTLQNNKITQLIH